MMFRELIESLKVDSYDDLQHSYEFFYERTYKYLQELDRTAYNAARKQLSEVLSELLSSSETEKKDQRRIAIVATTMAQCIPEWNRDMIDVLSKIESESEDLYRFAIHSSVLVMKDEITERSWTSLLFKFIESIERMDPKGQLFAIAELCAQCHDACRLHSDAFFTIVYKVYDTNESLRDEAIVVLGRLFECFKKCGITSFKNDEVYDQWDKEPVCRIAELMFYYFDVGSERMDKGRTDESFRTWLLCGCVSEEDIQRCVEADDLYLYRNLLRKTKENLPWNEIEERLCKEVCRDCPNSEVLMQCLACIRDYQPKEHYKICIEAMAKYIDDSKVSQDLALDILFEKSDPSRVLNYVKRAFQVDHNDWFISCVKYLVANMDRTRKLLESCEMDQLKRSAEWFQITDDMKPEVRVLMVKGLCSLHPRMYHEYISEILNLALTDTSDVVRCACINVMTAPYPEVLMKNELAPSLLFDSSFEVRHAWVRVLCEQTGSSSQEAEQQATQLFVDYECGSLMERVQYSGLFVSIVKGFPSVREKQASILLGRALKELGPDRKPTEVTFYQNKHTRMLILNWLQILELLCENERESVNKDVDHVMDTLIFRLENKITPQEDSYIVKAIYSIVPKLPYKDIEKHVDHLYQILWTRTGKESVDSDVHGIIFKLLGFFGYRHIPEPEAPQYVTHDDAALSYEMYRCRLPSERNRFYAKLCFSVILDVVHDSNFTDLHAEAIEVLFEIFCSDHEMLDFSDLSAFLPVFWSFILPHETKHADMMRRFCLLEMKEDWTRRTVREYIDNIFKFGRNETAIGLFEALAFERANLLLPYLQEICGFIYSSEASVGVRCKGIYHICRYCCEEHDGRHALYAVSLILEIGETEPSAAGPWVLFMFQSFDLKEAIHKGMKFCLNHLELKEMQQLFCVLVYRHPAFRKAAYYESAEKRLTEIPKECIEQAKAHQSCSLMEVQDDGDTRLPETNQEGSDKERKFGKLLGEADRMPIGVWLNMFMYSVIREAPCESIRKCAGIAEKIPTVAFRLLNIAVHSVLTAEQDLVPKLGEIILKILEDNFSDASFAKSSQLCAIACSLVDFMDRTAIPLVKYEDLSRSQVSPLGLSLQVRSNWFLYGQEGILERLADCHLRLGWTHSANTLVDTEPSIDRITNILPKKIREFVEKWEPEEAPDEAFKIIGDDAGSLFRESVQAAIPYVIASQTIWTIWETKYDVSKMPERYHDNMGIRGVRTALFEMVKLKERNKRDTINEKTYILHFVARAGFWFFKDSLDVLFPKPDKYPPKIEYDYLWTGFTSGLFGPSPGPEFTSRLNNLLEGSKDPSLNSCLVRLKAMMLLRCSDSEKREYVDKEYMNNLMEVADKLQSRAGDDLESCYALALVNRKIAEVSGDETRSEYQKRAFSAFAKCVAYKCEQKQIVVSYLLQMLELAFGDGSILDIQDVRKELSSVPRSAYRPIVDHCLSYVSSLKNDRDRLDFLVELMMDVLHEFPDTVVWEFVCHMHLPDNHDDDNPVISACQRLCRNSERIGSIFKEAERMFKGLDSLSWTLPRIVVYGLRELSVFGDGDSAIQDSFRKEILSKLRDRVELSDKSYDGEIRSRFGSEKVQEIMNWVENWNDSSVRKQLKQRCESIVKSIRQEELASDKYCKLRYVCEDMAKMRDTSIAMFGLVQSGNAPITVQGWVDEFSLIDSKTRPKIVSVIGSDGNKYKYILKGAEDIRVDQRVMELFTLLNSVFKYKIQTYAVVPLSDTMGLIQYLNNTDCMGTLIKEYRKNVSGMSSSLEWKWATESHFVKLDDVNKLKVFKDILDKTDACKNDLREILWLRSCNASSWLDCSARFSRSYAVMCMAGHVIGLGDRHPGNILIERSTHRVIHIDFGDSLWRAQKRAGSPERVPFRLTRMIEAALGPDAIRDVFLRASYDTIGIMRNQREAVMSVLQIFKDNSGLKGMLKPPRPCSEDLRNAGSCVKLFERYITEADVKTLIEAAKDDTNLCRMYPGWSPWW